MRTIASISCALAFAILLAPSNARAVYSCGGQKDDCQCGKANPFPCCSDASHGPDHGNCTWWAWEQACCNWGSPALPTYGNANDWLNEAKAAGWPTTNKAAVGTVFVYTGGSLGHVGWVYEVKADGGFCSSEQGCYAWKGVINDCHSSSYAQGFICKKGTSCESQPPPQCSTKVTKGGDTIIDDTNACFARSGTPDYWWEAAIGYGNHMWYTYATDDAVDNYGVWTLNVQDAGDYEVLAYIPGNNATSHQAKYQVRHNGQDGWATVNQNDLSDVWISLGKFYFAAGGEQYVRLNDSTGEDYNQYKRKVGFDAVKLVPGGGQPQCNPPDCNDGNPCTDDKCVNGSCTHSNNAAACDDGNGCTTGDHCSNGKCVAGGPTDCSFLNGPCATGVCSAGKCTAQPKAGACDDGNPCTTADHCENGQCKGSGQDCSFLSDACNQGTCSGGQCVKQPKAGACDDGDPCTVADQCQNGACAGGAPKDCSFLNGPCSSGYCSGGQCLAKPQDGGPCDDGDACSTGDHCVNGQCVGSATPCEGMNDACNTGVCQAGGCVKQPKSGPCDDGNPCTLSDSCANGACGGVQIDCSGMADGCNDGGCEEGQCIKVPKKQAPCDDGDPCTTGDACVGGTCMPGAKVSCDDGDPCTKDTCDAGGACSHQPKATCCKSDSECKDDQDCTDDLCVTGDCVHPAKDPKAGKVCSNGKLHWMDSCGETGAVASDCTCGCKNGACLTGSCQGRECGTDGCGGSCGTCLPGQQCIEGRDGTAHCGDAPADETPIDQEPEVQPVDDGPPGPETPYDPTTNPLDAPPEKGKAGTGGGCGMGGGNGWISLILLGLMGLLPLGRLRAANP